MLEPRDRLSEAQSRFRLANELNRAAHEAAGLLRTLSKELFEVCQMVPTIDRQEMADYAFHLKIENLAESLEDKASGNVTDASCEVSDASRTLAWFLLLSENHRKALRLIAAWENKTEDEYITWGLVPLLEMSFQEMEVFATGGDMPGWEGPLEENQAWARKFYDQVRPLMETEAER